MNLNQKKPQTRIWGESAQITVRLPVEMLQEIDSICKKDFSSRSTWLIKAVEKALEKTKKD